MTDTQDLIKRLKDACNGHPHAKIPWPHRLLHEAADALAAHEWKPIDDNTPKNLEVDLWHPENGMFVGFYSDLDTMIVSNLIKAPPEELKELSEEELFKDQWWGFDECGIFRASDYGDPTHYKLRIEPTLPPKED